MYDHGKRNTQLVTIMQIEFIFILAAIFIGALWIIIKGEDDE